MYNMQNPINYDNFLNEEIMELTESGFPGGLRFLAKAL
jgi:hypothetical protein